jgi:hypothetical protein
MTRIDGVWPLLREDAPVAAAILAVLVAALVM